MHSPIENLIQIAGVIDDAEARMLVECGADTLGFPLRLAVHREDLTEQEAARIVRRLRPPARGVLITYLDRAAEIAAFCRKLGTPLVQLHGDILPEELLRLKAIAPELCIIKSLIVREDNLSELEATIRDLGSCTDAFITDTFDPATGACGATGKTHDWEISRKIVELSPRPVILAGGLTPDNVRRAILEVKPDGVDVHTGVEDPSGRKDRELVETFVSEARKGFASVT